MCPLPPITPEGARRIEIPQLSFQNTATLKFWEIDKSFKCPVVGLCLTASEQKQLLKKTGLLKNKSPYEIHEILVSCAESENFLSQKVDRLLNHKFGDRVAALHRLSEQELMRGWQAAFEAGHYCAELWAAVSRPDLSAASGREIFGAVHMAMHTGAGQLAVASRRKGESMNSSFTIEFQKRDGNLHVQPEIDLDGASAWELLNLLHEQYNGHGRVFIDTNRLRRIHPFGCDTFKCRLNPKRVPADRLFFKGEKGPELAPSGSLRTFCSMRQPGRGGRAKLNIHIAPSANVHGVR